MKQSKTINQYLSILSVLSLVLLFNACGAGMPVQLPGYMSEEGSSSESSVSMSDQEAVASKALQILANQCSSCHTASSGPAGVFGLTNADQMIQSGLIVPGQPDQSRILNVIEANRMPPSSPLGATDKSIIRAWIAGGGAAPSTPPNPSQPPPSNGGGGPTNPVPVTGSLEEKAVAILTNNCYSCHGTATNGGLTKINEPASVVASGFITPGNSGTSKIYVAINSGRMPVGGSKLSAADIQIISDWITAGAKAPAAGTTPPPPTLPPLGPNFKSLNANIFLPKCAGCHSGTRPPEGVRLDSYTNIRANISEANEMIAEGEMPPSPNPKLSAAEKKAISDWIRLGTPND